MSARDKLMYLGLDGRQADALLGEHAHELAEKQRDYVGSHGLIYTGTVGEVIDLIDPEVSE